MTVKELALFFGKSENTIRRAAVKCGVESKNGVALVFVKSDVELISQELWDKVPETVKLAIEETFPNGTPNGKVEIRKAKLPSGAQLREMRLGLPQIEFMKRIDFMIGFSSKAKHQELIEVVPKEQGLLQFEEIKSKFSSNKN